MKKAYVKPVMESEAFVANEYVAACWIVSCGCELINAKVEADKDAFPNSVINGNVSGVHVGQSQKRTSEPCPSSESEYKFYHHKKATSGSTITACEVSAAINSAAPNASV